jgi:hypothetical protein
MRQALKKQEWTYSEDLAGRYAARPASPREETWQPAANEVASRDYTAEARSAESLVEGFVEEIADNKIPDTRPIELDITGKLRAPMITVAPDVQQAYFISTQEWDGYVTDVGPDAFEAVIYPVARTEEFRQDTVSVPLWLIDEDARHRVRPGAIFRLATGRQRRKRQIMHGARVYFRMAADMRKQEGLDREALEAFFAD